MEFSCRDFVLNLAHISRARGTGRASSTRLHRADRLPRCSEIIPTLGPDVPSRVIYQLGPAFVLHIWFCLRLSFTQTREKELDFIFCVLRRGGGGDRMTSINGKCIPSVIPKQFINASNQFKVRPRCDGVGKP